MSISYGKDNNKWEIYGIHQREILHNQTLTKYRTLERNGKIVTISTKQYSILPNEEALKIADKVTSAIGLKPFGHKYTQHFEKIADHAIIDKETRLNAFYAQSVDHVNGEEVFVGLHVFNSIDRSTAFGAGAFTFRVTCQNQVMATLRKLSATMPQAQTIDYIYQKHTGKAFEEQFFSGITNRMAMVVDRLQDVIETYRLMAQTKLDVPLMEKIKESKLPAKVQPEYLKTEKNQSLIAPDITQWQLYNDITESIWHNEKTSLQSKQANYNILHQVMPIQVTH